MTLADKTVKELRAMAEERGLKVPKSAKKADIVAMLEEDGPIEVRAEIVENGLAVPGKALSIDTAELVSKVNEITDALDELQKVSAEMDATDEAIASMPIEDVKTCKKALSDAIKEAEERRKEFGRILRKPTELVNARCKELSSDAMALHDRYKSRVDDYDEDRRIEHKNLLREHYEAYAGLLADVVPYDKRGADGDYLIHDERWLNKTCPPTQAVTELEDRVDHVARDWESLKTMNLEFYEDAEARFFDTLDLGESIAWANKLAEDKRKIEAMKAEIAPQPEPEADAADDVTPLEAYEGVCDPDEEAPCEPEPYAAPAQPIPAQPMPMPVDDGKERVIADIAALLEWYELSKLENLRAALKAAREPQGAASQRVMVIDSASQEQLDVIGKFCGLAGVTGTFKNGTLADVVARENQKKAAQRPVYAYGA